MWIEFWSRRDLREIGDVFDKLLLDVMAVLGGHERGRRAGLHREWRDCLNQFLLQPVQIRGRLHDNTCKANRRTGDIVILECLQFPAVGFSLAKTFFAAA